MVCPPLVYKPPGAAVAALPGVNGTLLYDVDGDGRLDLVAWGPGGVAVYTASGGLLRLSNASVECSVARGFLECGGRAWWRGGFLPPGRIPAPPFGEPVSYGRGWLYAGGVNVSTPCTPFTAWSDGVHYVVVASCPGSGAVYYIDAREGRVFEAGLPGEPAAASPVPGGLLVEAGGRVLLVSWGGVRLVAVGRLYPGTPPIIYADGRLVVYGVDFSAEPLCEPSHAAYHAGVLVAACGATAYVYARCPGRPVLRVPGEAVALHPVRVSCEHCNVILVNGTAYPAPSAVVTPRRPGVLLVEAVLESGWCRDVAAARVPVAAARPRLVVEPLGPVEAGGVARLRIEVVYGGVNVSAECIVSTGNVSAAVTAPAVVELPVGYVDALEVRVSCRPLNESLAPVSVGVRLPALPARPAVNVTHPYPGVVGFVASPESTELRVVCVGNGTVSARGVGVVYVRLPSPGSWRCVVYAGGPGLRPTLYEYRVEYRVVGGGVSVRSALVVDRVVTRVEYVTRTLYLTVRAGGGGGRAGGGAWVYAAAGLAAGVAVGYLAGRRGRGGVVALGG